jgi:protein-S-isoprenylcysteine O-methyltransferase Ste14
VTRAADETPGVLAPPPLIYLVPLAAGILTDHFRPTPFVPGEVAGRLGPALLFLGLVFVPALVSFGKARTAPEPWKPSTALVTSGVYRFSRNPMYLGMALTYLGVAVWANALAALLLFPVALAAIRVGVIAREEAYLERRFGDEYRAYKARVRRWL